MFYCISTFYLYYSNYLNIGATHAIAVGTDSLIEELKIPEDYWMTLQIGSKEHFLGLRSVPAFLNRSQYCHKCDKGYSNENAECHNCCGPAIVVMREYAKHKAGEPN